MEMECNVSLAYRMACMAFFFKIFLKTIYTPSFVQTISLMENVHLPFANHTCGFMHNQYRMFFPHAESAERTQSLMRLGKFLFSILFSAFSARKSFYYFLQPINALQFVPIVFTLSTQLYINILFL
jgi:hypothetical protein